MPRDHDAASRRRLSTGELPHQLSAGARERTKRGVEDSKGSTWGTVVRAAQGNFDHLMSLIRDIVRGHNSLVDDVDDLREYVEEGLDDTPSAEHTHDGTDPDGGGGTVAHGSLSGVTANQHHNQAHTQADHDVAEAADIAAVGTAAAAGSSTEVPNADHVHPHEPGHVVHDTVFDAKGDLVVGTGPDAATRVPVGADGNVLKADSTTGSGVAWGDAASALVVQEEDVTKVAAATTLDFKGSDFNVTDEGSGEARIELAAGGTRTAYRLVPAWAFEGSATESTTGSDPDRITHAVFPTTGAEMSGLIIVPEDWDGASAITVDVIWAPVSDMGAGVGVRWRVTMAEWAAGDLASETQVDTGATVENVNTNVVTYTSVASITPAAIGRAIRVVVNRDAAHVDDDYGSSVKCWGIRYSYTSQGVAGPQGAPGTSGIEVKEEGVSVDTDITVLDFDGSDFNLTETPENEVNIGLNYGTGAGQPAEGNHTHAGGSGHTIEENGTPLTARTGLNFQDGIVATDDAGGDETDINLDYAGTTEIAAVGDAESAGTSPKVARGDHVHEHGQLSSPSSAHDAVDIDIADAGGYYTGTEVEAALQEIGAGDAVDPIGGPNIGAFIRRIAEGKRAFFYSDMWGGRSDLGAWDGNFNAWFSGSGTNATHVAGESNHPGIGMFETGTTAAGRSGIHLGFVSAPNGGALNEFVCGSGRVRAGWLIKTDSTLSDGTNGYRLRFGAMNSVSGAPADGVFFEYEDDVNSGAWQGTTFEDSVSSTDPLDDNGGAITVAASTWYFLEIEVNAASSQVDFYINHVLKGSITTNIPDGNDPMTLNGGIYKSSGTTERVMYVDMAYLLIEMSSAR